MTDHSPAIPPVNPPFFRFEPRWSLVVPMSESPPWSARDLGAVEWKAFRTLKPSGLAVEPTGIVADLVEGGDEQLEVVPREVDIEGVAAAGAADGGEGVPPLVDKPDLQIPVRDDDGNGHDGSPDEAGEPSA